MYIVHVYNVVLVKNDTIVSVIICYGFYHNDFDMFFALWWKYSCMINAYLNIVVYLWLLDANISNPGADPGGAPGAPPKIGKKYDVLA